MDTKLATARIRLNEWAGIIRECRSSGMKVDDYCNQHGISRDAYYYWLRKVKAEALSQAGFVEVPSMRPAAEPLQHFEPQLMIKAGLAELYISSNTPDELILKALKVVCHAE